MKNHDLIKDPSYTAIRVQRRPVLAEKGQAVDGLFNAWISLDNPEQYNSYTTAAIKEIILALRAASNDRTVVAVILTAVGDKAFCSGGNTKEYAEYYAGNPQEYKQYMRLFNDMVTTILLCDKPVINRVNGLRVGGGQEIGMACDFSIAADTARFGQAGPRHGSAPDGGSTDFLHLYVGIGAAIESCTLCEPWSARRAARIGLINRVVPVLKNPDGEFIANPLVVDEQTDAWGNDCYGDFKTGTALAEAKALFKQCQVDFSRLDAEVEQLSCALMHTFPDCLSKTLESLRKKKLEHWQRNSETNRSWLALNMMTEARAGFRAFNEGRGGRREVDFVRLRQALGQARPWDDTLLAEILP